MSQNKSLSISQIAKETGINPSALRYYESLGILPAPQRVNGRRCYETETLAAVRFIQAAQMVGFTLGEIKGILDNPPDGRNCCTAQLQDIARQKIREVDALIERATAMKKILEQGLDCRCSSLDECLIFIPIEANVVDE